MRPSRQPRHIQLLEKFMIDWERKVRNGVRQPMTVTERTMAEVFSGWITEKYTLLPLTVREIEKQEVEDDQRENRV